MRCSRRAGWSDIVRELYFPPDAYEATVNNSLISLYFISFMLIVSLILMQVAHAAAT
jgi:hypothetical protein